MKNFEFKSKVTTSREQSERLLKLGLKKETADMHHYKWSEGYWDIQACPPRGDSPSYIPAWSLHRLIELYSDVEDTSSLCIKDVSYKLIIFCIEKAIHCGFFNKDYLEGKQ